MRQKAPPKRTSLATQSSVPKGKSAIKSPKHNRGGMPDERKRSKEANAAVYYLSGPPKRRSCGPIRTKRITKFVLCGK